MIALRPGLIVGVLSVTLIFSCTPLLAQESPSSQKQTFSSKQALDHIRLATQQVEAWIESCTPPVLFSTGQIRQGRDLAKKVGWSESIIQSLSGESLSEIENLWNRCVTVALLGDAERLQSLSRVFDELLEKISFGSRLEDTSLLKLNLLCRSYDCMTALPEWKKVPARLREKIQLQLHKLVASCQASDRSSISHPLLDRSIMLYAGLLTGSTPSVNESINGTPDNPGLFALMNRDIAPEGKIGKCNFPEHISIASHLLTAGAVIKQCSSYVFNAIQPWLKDTVMLVGNLAYPDGYFPTCLQHDQGNKDNLIRLLELGKTVLGLDDFNFLLQQLYQTTSRKPETILWGSVIEKSKETVQGPPSMAYPLSGAVILNQATKEMPLSLFLDTGLSGTSPSTGLLSIEWKNRKRPHRPQQKSNGTDIYNTVFIDRNPQSRWDPNREEAQNALLYSQKVFEDGATYTRAIAAGQYMERRAYPPGTVSTPVSTYERSLFVSPSFSVDWFRVRGGQIHDWIFHGASEIDRLIGGEWSSLELKRTEYDWLLDSSFLGTKLNGIYGVSFKGFSVDSYRHRLWFVDPVGTQLISATKQGLSSLIARRIMDGDEGDLYTVIHKWNKGTDALDLSIRRLPLTPSPNRRDFQANAFVIQEGNDTNIFLSSINPNQEYTTHFEGKMIVFQGSWGHIHVHKAKLKRLRLVGGTTLRMDTHGVQLKSPVTLGIIRAVDSDTATIGVDMGYPIPSGSTLAGEGMVVLSNREAPVMYRTLIVDTIDSAQVPQTVHLMHRPNADNLSPYAGQLIQPGNQVIFENHAELAHHQGDAYSLTSSAPADVMIEAATKRHRVLLTRSNLVRKVRGEYTVGTIQFHVDPNESVEGRVEFIRIP